MRLIAAVGPGFDGWACRTPFKFMDMYFLGLLLLLLLGDWHLLVRYCLLMLALTVVGVLVSVSVGYWLSV